MSDSAPITATATSVRAKRKLPSSFTASPPAIDLSEKVLLVVLQEWEQTLVIPFEEISSAVRNIFKVAIAKKRTFFFRLEPDPESQKGNEDAGFLDGLAFTKDEAALVARYFNVAIYDGNYEDDSFAFKDVAAMCVVRL